MERDAEHAQAEAIL
jgi:hypothetical protein